MSKQAYRIAHKTQAIKTPGQDKAKFRQNQAAQTVRAGFALSQARRRGG